MVERLWQPSYSNDGILVCTVEAFRSECCRLSERQKRVVDGRYVRRCGRGAEGSCREERDDVEEGQQSLPFFRQHANVTCKHDVGRLTFRHPPLWGLALGFAAEKPPNSLASRFFCCHLICSGCADLAANTAPQPHPTACIASLRGLSTSLFEPIGTRELHNVSSHRSSSHTLTEQDKTVVCLAARRSLSPATRSQPTKGHRHGRLDQAGPGCGRWTNSESAIRHEFGRRRLTHA